MSRYPLGQFDRSAVPRLFRRFCPMQSVENLEAVDIDALAAAGKRLLLLDVDNTLLPWRGNEIPPETHQWLDRCKALGLQLCILSNTRHPERLVRLAGEMDVPYLRGRFKPSTQMYHAARSQFDATADETVMIGDQLFTDVWGANRAGIDAVWVHPSSPRDFVGTKISRHGERLLTPSLRRALREGAAVGQNAGVPTGLLQRPVIRQFAKFCVVGGTSTVIDLGIHYLLMFEVMIGGVPLPEVFGNWALGLFGSPVNPAAATQFSFTAFKVFSACIAILNSFVWNRRWTFRIRGKEDRHQQLVKFVLVAVVGMLLNTVVSSGLNSVIPGHPKRSWAIASAVATIVVAFWNFTGQKLWTFRQKRA